MLKIMWKTLFIEIYNQQNNSHPANIYLFKINNVNTRERCETCSKLQ